MTKRKREDRERRRKLIEDAGYRIEYDGTPFAAFPWKLRNPSGKALNIYCHEARAITGAEIDMIRQRQGGQWKGRVKIAEDFDAPLDEFEF